jgi:cell division protein FtsQ
VIDERIAERRAVVRDERRRARLRRTRWVLGLLLLVGLLVVVERSPLVGLDRIEVTGTERLDPDEVRTAAALPLGTSTVRLRSGEVAARVETLPLVRRAHVQRLDPLSVRIEVEERVPTLVASGRGVQRLVDRDGVVISDGGLDGLPVVTLRQAPPEVGGDVDDLPALGNAYRAWSGLSGDLRVLVARYDARGPDDLWLELTSGTVVRFGRAERIDEKVRALGAILGDLGDQPVALIDVRAPSAPVVVRD